MRNLTSNILAAIRAPAVETRDFVWIIAKRRDNGNAAPIGFWSGAGAYQAAVTDPVDGVTVNRLFNGSAIEGVSDIALTTGLEVQSVKITLSAIDAAAQQAFRGTDAKGAPIRVFRGYFDPGKGVMIDAAQPRFVGVINTAEITRAKEGEQSTIEVEAIDDLEQLRRETGFVRSLADQQSRRDASDDFHRDVEAMAQREIAWGKNRVVASKGGKGGSEG